MKQKRIEYALLALFILILLFSFSEKYLLVLLILLFIIMVMSYFLTRSMMNALTLHVSVKESCSLNEDVHFHFHIDGNLALPISKGLKIKLVLTNTFVNEANEHEILLEFGYGCRDYTWTQKTDSVGTLRLHVKKAEIMDLFGLVSQPVSLCNDASTTVYPKWINTEFSFSQESFGYLENEGIVENIHGNDRNEILNYREYIPGDDIRNIHWKLSAKTDEIFVRETANTHHFDVLLLNDIGSDNGNKKPSKSEINMCISCFYATAQKLVEYKVPFCIGICMDSGIEIHEIQNQNDLDKTCAECLQYTLPRNYGNGLSYFDLNHYENVFSRLIYVSSGKTDNFSLVNGRISGVIVSIEKEFSEITISSSGSFSFVQMPVELKEDAIMKLIC